LSSTATRTASASLPSLVAHSHIRGVSDGPPTIYDESFAADVSALNNTVATTQNDNTITSLLVCPQSFILTASTDRTVRYYDTQSIIDSYHVVPSPPSSSYRYAARTDTPTGAVHYEENVVESATAAVTPSLTGHSGAITALAAMEFPSRMFATASRDGTVKVFI